MPGTASPLRAPACRSPRPPTLTTGPPHGKSRPRRLHSGNARAKVTLASPEFNHPNQGRAAGLLRARGFSGLTPPADRCNKARHRPRPGRAVVRKMAGPERRPQPSRSAARTPTRRGRFHERMQPSGATCRTATPSARITPAGPTSGPARTMTTGRRVGRRRRAGESACPDHVSRPPTERVQPTNEATGSWPARAGQQRARDRPQDPAGPPPRDRRVDHQPADRQEARPRTRWASITTTGQLLFLF